MVGRAVCTILLLAAASLLLPAPAVADALRCDTDLVTPGMTPLEVVERCGQPDYTYAWTDFRYPGIFVHVDEWTYDLGTNKFRRLLTFENGRLVRIETRPKPTGALQSSTDRSPGLSPGPPARF